MLKFVKDKISFISGICLVLLSLLLFYEASSLSPFGSVFPYAITTALLILSVILIFRSFKFEIKVINEKISFIKIDVEGHEIEVLRGAKNSVKRDKPVILIQDNDKKVINYLK